MMCKKPDKFKKQKEIQDKDKFKNRKSPKKISTQKK